MKKWLTKLTPGWLTLLDQWLLTHHPILWRSRVLWLLVLAVPAALILFGLGLLWPTSPLHPVIEPIGRYVLNDHHTSGWTSAMAVLVMAYWGYLQFRYRGDYPGFKGLMAKWGVYLLGGFLMLPVLITAFPYGELLRHAYGMMDQEDVEQVAANGYYAYGVTFPPGTTAEEFRTMLLSRQLEEAHEHYRAMVRGEQAMILARYEDKSSSWNLGSRGTYVQRAVPASEVRGDFSKLNRIYGFQRNLLHTWPAVVDSTY
ncbi:MAG: hypothetical protein AAF804_02485, partial [Bacteroidota bacterium]